MNTLRRSLPFSLALIAPLLGIDAALHLGWHLALVPLFVFVLVPLLDLLLGRSAVQLEDEGRAAARRDWRYDLWLWLWIPLQLAGLLLSIEAVRRGRAQAPGTLLALSLTTGLVTGVGINVAHELMHRKGALERALAELLLTASTYTHFCVEHVLGHHKHVGTPRDPATSRLGETLYSFLPRTLRGGLMSAWRLETARVRKLRLGLSLRDRRVRYAAVLAVVYMTLVIFAGPRAALFFAAQSAVGFTLLEVINFIEHYGLARRELSPGTYERCLPVHSWNASERFTNQLLFHLQRHADHHHLASRPYFTLRHIDDSPQLPAGYATLVLCALVPPLFRAVMDPRVVAWNARGAAPGAEAPAA